MMVKLILKKHIENFSERIGQNKAITIEGSIAKQLKDADEKSELFPSEIHRKNF